MSCKRCGEQDNFCDGNEEEELCKHCLDHCCEECFNEFNTEQEYEHHLCKDCYTNNFFDLPKKLYKTEPKYFTFSDEDIAEYEEEQILIKKLQEQVKIKLEEKKQKQ